MGRFFEQKTDEKSGSDWQLVKTVYIIYDGYKLIASYLWQLESVGLDVPLMRVAGASPPAWTTFY